MNKASILAAALIVGVAFAAGIYFSAVSRDSGETPDIAGFLWPDPPRLAPFSLDRANGELITENDLKGRWTLIFFGFANCPDVCPTTMNVLNEVVANFRAEPEISTNLQVMFVSVDPERDSPHTLQSYVGYFNEDFIAATAQDERLEAFAKQFGVLHMKVKTGIPDAYTVDHSASILMVSPGLDYVGIFSQPHEAQDISERIRRIVAFVDGGQG